jgi:hypothetical protein
MMVYRRAEAATVNAMTNGSQHSTVSAIGSPDGPFAVGVDRLEMTVLHAAVHYNIGLVSASRQLQMR